MRRLMPLAVLLPAVAIADPPTVVGATAERVGGHWRFEVTVAHADEGWHHFADLWEILAPDGRRLALREAMHPNTEDATATRTISAVYVPSGVTRVLIRAHDTEDGWGEALVLELPD